MDGPIEQLEVKPLLSKPEAFVVLEENTQYCQLVSVADGNCDARPP
jgi:hypothetical protein